MTSFLLPLEPEGAGTYLVEAQSSFLPRLARHHHITVRQFITLLDNWARSKDEGVQSFRTAFSGSFMSTNNYGFSAAVLFALLDNGLLRSDLSATTLHIFVNVAATSASGALKRWRAWCAECWATAISIQKPIYDPLIFLLQSIRRCPVHRLQLIEKCPRCSIRQTLVHHKGYLDRCYRCDQSLIPPIPQIQDLVPSIGERDFSECLAYSASNPQYSYPKGAAHVFFEHFRKRIESLSIERPDRWRKYAAFHFAMRKRNRPSLATLIDVSQATGISLHHLLSDPVAAAGSALTDQAFLAVRTPRKKLRLGNALRVRVMKTLQKAIRAPVFDDEQNLNSLRKSLGVSPGYLNYWFPSECQALVAKRKKYLSKMAEKKQKLTEQVVRTIGIPKYLRGQWSSHDTIVAELRKQHGLSTAMLRFELQRQLHGTGRRKNTRVVAAFRKNAGVDEAIVTLLRNKGNPMTASAIKHALKQLHTFPSTQIELPVLTARLHNLVKANAPVQHVLPWYWCYKKR